jgi:hypothetical protein
MAAAWIASSDPAWYGRGATSYIGTSFSADSGATWTPVQVLRAPAPDDRYAYDPAIAVDAANNFYVVFGAAGTVLVQNEHKAGIWVAKAPKGTTTFGVPTETTDPADSLATDAGPAVYWFDKPWMAVMKDQEIVVTYARLEWASCPLGPGTAWHDCVSNIMSSRSTDARSWIRAPVTANSAGSGPRGGAPDFVNYAFPCASTTSGRLWVVYDSFPAAGGIEVTLRFSDDGGATWNPADATVVSPATFMGMDAEDPSCVASGNDVWVSYEVHSIGETFATSIQVAHSTDGGRTFDRAVNVLDSATSRLGWHSSLVLESNGALDVEYYGGASAGDKGAGVYYVRSTDHGATWGKATLLRQPITLFDYRTAGGWAVNWLGDYLGLATASGSLYTTFTDNSTGTAHIDFAKVKLP